VEGRRQARATRSPKGASKDSEPSFSHESIKLASGEFEALLFIKYWKEVKVTREAFDGEVIAYDAMFDGNANRTRLPKLGEEAYLWPGKGARGYAVILFRKGNLYVHVSAPSAEVAKKFAHHMLELTAAPK
jgi:hypothetical protein